VRVLRACDGIRDARAVAAAVLADPGAGFTGAGVEEVGTDKQGRTIVRVDKRYFRPTEVDTLLSDASKAGP